VALHRSYVSDVEAGVRNLSRESLERLSRVLGSSLSSVFDAIETGSGILRFKAGQTGMAVAEILLVEDDPKDIELTLAAFRQPGVRIFAKPAGLAPTPILSNRLSLRFQPGCSQVKFSLGAYRIRKPNLSFGDWRANFRELEFTA